MILNKDDVVKGCQEQLATHLEQEYSKVKVRSLSNSMFIEHQRVLYFWLIVKFTVANIFVEKSRPFVF